MLDGQVERGFKFDVDVFYLSAIAEQEAGGLRLSFPAGAVQRGDVFLVFCVQVSALYTTN